MQTTLAQQLIIFSFSTSLFMMFLVGVIMCISILRIMRLQRLELAYIQANRMPLRGTTNVHQPEYKRQYASRDTRPRRPKFNTTPTTQVDIQITSPESTLIDAPYKPRPVSQRSEKIG
ncbi:MAG: hypothetical protein RLP44_10770 [Aggregatilineales bacterium]